MVERRFILVANLTVRRSTLVRSFPRRSTLVRSFPKEALSNPDSTLRSVELPKLTRVGSPVTDIVYHMVP
jgi:hypothetical protein